MRDIKFRVWDKKNAKWYHIPIWSESEANADSIDGVLTLRDDEFFQWCQYTGLKDKNGIEIYEGDILERPTYQQNSVDTEVGTVYYSNRGTWDWQSFLLGGKNERAVVIGNIHENPELLTTAS